MPSRYTPHRAVARWPFPRPIGLAGRILLIPPVIALAAMLAAVAVLPTVAGAGQAVTKFDSQFLGAGGGPLRIPALPQRSTIYAADGSVLASLFQDEDRQYVPLSRVNDVTRRAVLAIEDHKFYEHGPLDVTSIIRAALANIRAGHIVQGGSTITQQLIKNTETGNAETFARKFQEAQDSIRLERSYTKDQILELYLNEIYLGHRVYGVGTAAEYYFAQRVQDLTLPQAALLAGMIASPVAYDPIAHKSAALARRDVVLFDMFRYRWIGAAQYEQARKTPIRLSSKGRAANTAGPEPFWVRFVTNEFLANPAFGRTMADRRRALFQGGLRIYTTLQPKLQRAARKAITTHYPKPGIAPPADPEAALASVVPQTGAIVAMTSGTNFAQSQVDLASQGQRSTGSAFKAYTLAAAFEQGIPASKVYDSASPVTIPQAKCPNDKGEWMPANAEPGTGGFIDLRAATAGSVNVVFAQLIADVGPANVAEVARKMGLTGYIPDVCAITLGAVSVSPLAMAAGYSTLANGGIHCRPYAISRIVSSAGVVYRAAPDCQQVIPATVAAEVTNLLEGVICCGTGTRAQLPDFGTRPEAGKTGTGENHDDAWFMGYIAQLCAGVWVGYSKNESTSLAGVNGSGGFGGSLAAPVWHDFMAVAEQGLPVGQFPTPPPEKQGTVPNVVGLMLNQAVAALAKAKFTALLPPQMVDSALPAGTVVGQTPGAGTVTALGSGVTLQVSNGHPPKPMKVPVPLVVGLTKADAVAALKAAGFKVEVVIQPVSSHKDDGIVLSQAPAAAKKAFPGSTVIIVVGQFGPSP
jgi:membrane peptidoglycan carboxypeptidase